jgi:branched-chain amino acid aminotransferase
VIPWADATIQVHDAIYAAPSMVFEGIKAYRGAEGLQVFRLDEHIERFTHSMKTLRMRPSLGSAQLHAAVLELLRANEFNDDVYVVPVAFWAGGGLSRAFSVPEPEREVDIYIIARPFASAPNPVALSAGVSSWLRIPDSMVPPRVKAVANYYNWRLAYAEAAAAGYDTVLMMGPTGRITEGPGACVFLIRDNQVVTPDIVSGILESITRDTAIRLLTAELDMTVVERAVERSEFYSAQEAFFAGTGLEIAAMSSLDRIPIGEGEIGPVTAALQRLYDQVVRGHGGHEAWLTPVT